MKHARDWGQVLISAGVAVSGLIMLAQIPLIQADAGYAGIGPRFFPTVVGTGMLACGVLLLIEALTRGFPDVEEGPHDHEPFDRRAVALVAGGLVAHMALIEAIGFTLAGTLLGSCVTLALRGRPAIGVVASFAVSAAIYHAFGRLGVTLPAIATGWL